MFVPHLWEGPPSLEGISTTSLTLSGLAFLKLLTWRNHAPLEVCAFGLSHVLNPLFITDLILPYQEVSGAFCDPDEDHLAHLMNTLPYDPWRWAANWFHTHPMGMGPSPSGTDETTFASTRFSQASHSFMAIFGGNNEWSCRLRLPVVSPRFPSQTFQLQTVIRHDILPPLINQSEFLDQYRALVHRNTPRYQSSYSSNDNNNIPNRPPSDNFWEIYNYFNTRLNIRELNLNNRQIQSVAVALLDEEAWEYAVEIYTNAMEVDRKNILQEVQEALNLGRDITSKIPDDEDAKPYLFNLRYLLRNPHHMPANWKFPPSLLTPSSRRPPNTVDFTDNTPRATTIPPSNPDLWKYAND